MDFNATNERDAKAQRFAHTGMTVCLLLTGGVMLATLVLSPADPLQVQQTIQFSP